MLTRDDPNLGLEQDLAGVLSRSHEAGIQQFTVFVASELNLKAVKAGVFRSSRRIGGAGFRREGIIFSRRYFHLTDNRTSCL